MGVKNILQKKRVTSCLRCELYDEKCDSTNLLPTDGCWTLSASRILCDLKQPAASPSEARICTLITPFFKFSKHLNGCFVYLSLLMIVLDEAKCLAVL